MKIKVERSDYCKGDPGHMRLGRFQYVYDYKCWRFSLINFCPYYKESSRVWEILYYGKNGKQYLKRFRRKRLAVEFIKKFCKTR